MIMRLLRSFLPVVLAVAAGCATEGDATVGASSPVEAAVPVTDQHQLVAAYFDADWQTPNSLWHRMCRGMNAHVRSSVAVMNPASGPGLSRNINYSKVISFCHGANQKVVGYVFTRNGERPLATVKSDVTKYINWYPDIDGIFFDEMETDVATQAYYKQLYAFVKNKMPATGLVVGNPGTAYAGSAWQIT